MTDQQYMELRGELAELRGEAAELRGILRAVMARLGVPHQTRPHGGAVDVLDVTSLSHRSRPSTEPEAV